MAVPDRLATEYTLFLKSSAPTSAFDSSEYNECLYTRTLSGPEIGRDVQEASNRNSPGNGYWKEFTAGKVGVTISGDGVYDITEETGQQHLYDGITDTTVGTNNAVRWFLITSDTSGDQEYSGKGVINTLSLGFNDGELPAFSFSIQVTGALSEQAVP